MRLLVDTNRFADLAANNRRAHERLQYAAELWFSVITLGELRAGFTRGTRSHENEQRLTQLLELQGVGVLLLDRDTTALYAEVWKHLSKIGRKIPTNDVWIAAKALQHDLTLDTNDAHFGLVPQLKLIDELT